MITNFLMQWEQEFDPYWLRYLLVDEAGLLAEVKLMALLTYMPNIRQIFITGDKCQLPAYTGNLPGSVIPYGQRGVVHQLSENQQIEKLEFNVSYRSHPGLVERYPQQLMAVGS